MIAPPPDGAAAAAWQAFRAELLSRVRRRVPEPADAEDIVQAVIERLVARRGGVEEVQRLPAWLARVTANAIADHWRGVGRHRRRTAPVDPETLDIAVEDDADLGRRAMLDCLAPLMATLPAADRRALLLADGEGRPQKSVAAELGIGVSGAKSRIQRARRRLAEQIEACCLIERDGRGTVTGFDAACCNRPGPS